MQYLLYQFVVTTFNHAPYIKRCSLTVCSINRLTFPYEILVHDDASTDGTKQILEEYEERFPNRIRVSTKVLINGARERMLEAITEVFSCQTLKVNIYSYLRR